MTNALPLSYTPSPIVSKFSTENKILVLRRFSYFYLQVTGGSSGIGKCIAIECYKQGAFITLVARNEVSLIGLLLLIYFLNFIQSGWTKMWFAPVLGRVHITDLGCDS